MGSIIDLFQYGIRSHQDAQTALLLGLLVALGVFILLAWWFCASGEEYQGGVYLSDKERTLPRRPEWSKDESLSVSVMSDGGQVYNALVGQDGAVLATNVDDGVLRRVRESVQPGPRPEFVRDERYT